MWPNPDQAISYYASMRTYNQKGVTIPSQLRYVRYFHESLDTTYTPRPLLLTKVVFHTLPKSGNISDVDFSVNVGKATVFSYKQFVEVSKQKDVPKVHRVDSKKKKKDKKKDKHEDNTNGKEAENGESNEDEETAEFECGSVPVCGDVKMEFERKGEKMFAFWFNTFFVKDLHVIIDKKGLDKAHKDAKNNKLYEANFTVELIFEEMVNTPRKLTTVSSSPSISTTTTITTISTTTTSAPSSPKAEGGLSNSSSI